MANPFLEMRGMKKSFHGVKALSDVNLTIHAGQVHAIVGENGAGKSTLMKVLSDVYPHGDYEDEITFLGQECRLRGIHDSEARGITIIHQELALVPLLSMAVNMFLGNEPARCGVIDWSASLLKTRELLRLAGLKESPATLSTNLGVGKQQLIEIAKSRSKEVKLLILDEPTRGIDVGAKYAIYTIIAQLTTEGKYVLMISSEMPELLGMCDRICVLNQGRFVAGYSTAEATPKKTMHPIVTSGVH